MFLVLAGERKHALGEGMRLLDAALQQIRFTQGEAKESKERRIAPPVHRPGPLLAHCHRGLGTLYAATGQREQARTELSTAIDLYRAMDMTFWLPQTEAALAQVEGR